MPKQETSISYNVLNPWADADPVPARGLSAERPSDLSGKKIGLFYMWKRASKPILEVMERKITDRFPGVQFSWYEESQMNTPEIESDKKDDYKKWLSGLDTVIYTYGD